MKKAEPVKKKRREEAEQEAGELKQRRREGNRKAAGEERSGSRVSFLLSSREPNRGAGYNDSGEAGDSRALAYMLDFSRLRGGWRIARNPF